MEDPSEPLGVLSPPGAAVLLGYALALLAVYLLEAGARGLAVRGAGAPLPPPLPAAWFGHQAAADAAFAGLLPLALARSPSCRPLGAAYCRLDPGLAFLALGAAGRLLAREAADCWAAALWPAWAGAHRGARRAAFWGGAFWLLLLALGVPDPGGPRWGWGWGRWPGNGTGAPGLPRLSRRALTQLVFGFGVPLGVLGALHGLLQARLRLARLGGRPPLLAPSWASGALLFLCWTPFHLLQLLPLLGEPGAPRGLAEAAVLLGGPLGLALAGAGCLHPLLWVCGGQAFRRRLRGVLWPRPREGGSGAGTGGVGTQAQPSCRALRGGP